MNRRRFLTLAPAFLAAPAPVRATSIMPVRAVQWSPVFSLQAIGFDGSVLSEARVDLVSHGDGFDLVPRHRSVIAHGSGVVAKIAFAENGVQRSTGSAPFCGTHVLAGQEFCFGTGTLRRERAW